jgi:hypothetical protein
MSDSENDQVEPTEVDLAIQRCDTSAVESFFKNRQFPTDFNASLRHVIEKRDEGLAQLIHDEMQRQSVKLESITEAMWRRLATKAHNRDNAKGGNKKK